LSPPGSGLCLSVAYTFKEQPDKLPALTLALGLGAIGALEELGAHGIELKWPNDLIALEGKLGGILTEVQQQSAAAVMVVAGIGVNVDVRGQLDFGVETDRALQAVNLKDICNPQPSFVETAGQLTSHLLRAFVDFETSGFAATANRWARYDWLLGREVRIDTVGQQFSGIGAGIADDGALLVDTPETGIRRVLSGTIVMAGARGKS
jgi:BirA family biotin operon repressor/biotin-[acetyl-CoA-carboxylase] ligase